MDWALKKEKEEQEVEKVFHTSYARAIAVEPEVRTDRNIEIYCNVGV